MAWPLPRRGFHGRVSGPGFDIENDTDAVGYGKHIPDPFAGIGFTIESREHGWRLDIGASLWHYLAEGHIHKGIEQPILVYLNWPIN